MRTTILLALLLGCDATPVEPRDARDSGRDDAALPDAAQPDAGRGLDAALPDAGGDLDAGPRIDASPFDGGPVSFDAGGTRCSVGGASGVCLHVDVCDGVSTPGFCPGPAEIQCCTSPVDAGPPRDSGPPMSCDPDAMPTPHAGLTEAPGVGGCPAGMVPVADFCVDQYEASLALVESDGRRTPWSPYFNPGDERVVALSLRGAIPQGYITGRQAAAACAEAGKRLCTDTEWLRACQGASGATFPYGASRVPGVCNDFRTPHPAVEYFGTSADWIWSMLGHPCINQLADGLAPTGAHAGCVTDDSVYDMMGNLHEWTADPSGTFRGGYYVDTERNGPGCLYRTTAHSMGHWDYSTGFRCCADR